VLNKLSLNKLRPFHSIVLQFRYLRIPFCLMCNLCIWQIIIKWDKYRDWRFLVSRSACSQILSNNLVVTDTSFSTATCCSSWTRIELDTVSLNKVWKITSCAFLALAFLVTFMLLQAKNMAGCGLPVDVSCLRFLPATLRSCNLI
jgi:hypothetical protein